MVAHIKRDHLLSKHHPHDCPRRPSVGDHPSCPKYIHQCVVGSDVSILECVYPRYTVPITCSIGYRLRALFEWGIQ